MPRHSFPDSPPQISFSNWLVGGSLVKNSSQDRARREASAAKQAKTEKLLLNEKEKKEQAAKKEEKKVEKPKEEEKKKDENEDAAKKESPSFTEAQEKSILGMKAAHKSWKEISQAVNSTVSIVLAHYIALITAEATSEKESDDKKAEDVKAGKEKENETEVEEENKGEKDDRNKDSDDKWTEFQDDSLLQLKASNKSWKEIASTIGASKSDCVARHKLLLSREGKKKESPSPVSKDSPTTPTNESSNPKENTSNDSNRMSRAEDTSPPVRLTPDGIWSRDDCEVLELLEGRYREQKWLQIQAGFYNLTGRMVGAEVIRRKFGD